MYSEQFMMYLAEYQKEDIKKNKKNNKDKGFLGILFYLFELIKD